MPVPAIRTICPRMMRNFGRFGDTAEVPPLTDIQTISYDRFLQLDAPPEERTPTGLEGRAARKSSRSRATTSKISLEYIKYELGKPRYGPDECRQLRLTYGRPFRVWLRLNKERAGRGRSLPRRHAHHDRRRRVHHQRRRARRRQPVAPLARRRFRRRDRSGDRKLHSLPHHPGTRQLDRDQRHQERHARRPHRPVGQVLGHDAAARHGPGLLRRRATSSGRSTRPRSWPSTRTPAPSSKGSRGGRRRHRPGNGRGLPRQRPGRSPTRSSTSILASQVTRSGRAGQGQGRHHPRRRWTKIRPARTRKRC